jgi:hypothetical protein
MNVHIRKLAFAMALAAGCMSSGSQSRGTTEGTPTSSAEPQGSSGAQGSQASTGTQRPQSGTAGQEPLMEPGPAIKGHAEDQVVSGQVGRVSAFSLVIESDSRGSTTLEIVPETTIVVNGQDGTYAELQEGQPVRASYSEVEGHDVAVEIQVQGTRSGSAGSTSGGDLGTGSSGSGSSAPDSSSGPGSSGDTSPGSSTPGSSADPSGRVAPPQ